MHYNLAQQLRTMIHRNNCDPNFVYLISHCDSSAVSFISIVYVIIVEVFCVMEGAHFSKRHLIWCEVDVFFCWRSDVMCVDVWLFCFYEFAFSQTCLIGFETRIRLFRIW